MNGYVAVSRRTELVALADLAISRMTRDLRSALPNSVRVGGGGTVLELLHSTNGARYRRDPGINDPGGPNEQDHTAATDWLSFGGDQRFNVLGRFQNLPVPYGTPLPLGHRVAIYPTGVNVWAEAAAGGGPGVITPASTTLAIFDDGDEDQLQLSSAHRFRFTSPNARLFLVDTPITYLCDPGDASLWRIDRYAVAAAQPTNRGASPLSGGSAQRAADRVEQCRFSYSPGSPTRAGLVTIEMVLENEGERVRLLQQVQVQNAP
jgi:MSHA biogenesis protein MshO